MHSGRVFVLVSCVAAMAACGGKVASEDTSDAAPETIVEPGTPLPAPTYVDGCPSSAPAIGSSCASRGVVCEYGSDPNPACNTLVACAGGAWVAPTGFPACPASAQSSGHACPSPYPPAPGAIACPGNVGVVCDYRYPAPSGGVARVECACHDDARLGSIWDCANVVTDPNCPFPPPLLGTSCARDALECPRLAHLEGWKCVPTQVCTGGAWTLAPCKS